MHTLYELNPDQEGRILELNTRDETKRRLGDIGLTEGCVVRFLFAAPSGDPRAYSVRGSVIAMSNSTAQRIQVEITGN